MEIERKWLLQPGVNIPLKEFKGREHYRILQGYVSMEPETRIREMTGIDGKERYILTIKGNGELMREEFEHEITKMGFDTLMDIGKLKECQLIRKEYYKLQYGKLFIEASRVDTGSASEFGYAEIEFNSRDEADKFQPLAWFGREITYDKQYKMKNYWRITRKMQNEINNGSK